MSRRPFRYTAALMAAASLMAACSGSGSESSSSDVPVTEPPTTTEVVEELETTTTSTTTTTTTSTTTTSTTTLPEPVIETVPSTEDTEPPSETTEAPETPAPSNTIFDPETIEGEVEQVALANYLAFAECLSELPACDSEKATRFAALENKANNIELIEGWNSEGIEIRDIDTWVLAVESIVEFSDDRLEAVVATCSYDGSALVKPATDTAPEEIIGTSDVSTKSKLLLLKIGEAWFVVARERVETVPGQPDGFCQ